MTMRRSLSGLTVVAFVLWCSALHGNNGGPIEVQKLPHPHSWSP
jgi:hypothetical protein